MGGVDTLPLLGFIFPLIGKEPAKNKGGCSLHGQRGNEEELGVYTKSEVLGETVTFTYVVRNCRCVSTITQSKAQMFMQMEIFVDKNLYQLYWCVRCPGTSKSNKNPLSLKGKMS